jgi:hypothetical protein
VGEIPWLARIDPLALTRAGRITGVYLRRDYLSQLLMLPAITAGPPRRERTARSATGTEKLHSVREEPRAWPLSTRTSPALALRLIGSEAVAPLARYSCRISRDAAQRVISLDRQVG